jgi:ubiquinone/menaquinone biosynthesis C-methylase UbiE
MAASAQSYFFRENPVVNQVNFDDKDVLEIGCGQGDFTLAYLKNARSVLGVDPGAEAIEEIKARWSRTLQTASADFRCGKIEDLPLPDESFDCVVFSRSF